MIREGRNWKVNDKNLAKILLEKKILTQEKLEVLQKIAQERNTTLSDVIVKQQILTLEELKQLKEAESRSVVFVDIGDYKIDPELLSVIPYGIARKYTLIPLYKKGGSLTIAMHDPKDVIAIDEIRRVTGFRIVEPVKAAESDINNAIDHHYAVSGGIDEILREVDQDALSKAVTMEGEENLELVAEQAPIIKLVNSVIADAVKKEASDIHIEPDESILRLRYRIDGVLHEERKLKKHVEGAVISRIKVLSKLDIAERRRPQDGRIKMKVGTKEIELRVSTFPTIYGENVVMRILDKGSIRLSLSELGMPEKILKQFDEIIHVPYGIILLTGPTGSGKSTTLYASLNAINSIEKNIITVEDPVEYNLDLIRQTQVNPKIGFTFAVGLRSILRQDPDVIMVGEIRDQETAEIAIQSALTGHLVFSTLHTNDAPGGITRFVDMGVQPFLIASSVIGIMAQRLVRTICQSCKEELDVPKKLLDELEINDKHAKFYRGKGCKECGDTGYAGRTAIHELLVLSDKIKEMIVSRESEEDIKQEALKNGMQTLRMSGVEKAKQGITTLEEVLKVTQR